MDRMEWRMESMSKSKPHRVALDPRLAKVMKGMWTMARREARRKSKDRDLRRERLLYFASQHLRLARDHLEIAKLLTRNSK
jgi:hypothetical protein